MDKKTKMLAEQIIKRNIVCKAVINAMSIIDRDLFVPKEIKDKAYDDCPLPIGYGQTISQPYIVAFMLEKLEVKETDNILEVGAGSGYQAAILTKLAHHVTALELIPELAIEAKSRCKQLGLDNIEIINADGYKGWEQNAPYDKIIVAAAAPFIPEALIQQLKPGGILIIPVGKYMDKQKIKIITKDMNNNISSENSLDVRFVPLVQKNEP
jgi:protein-L-isoaspartate(D-aspartate) O-methyltransferase